MAEARELVDTVGSLTEGLPQSTQVGPKEGDAAPTPGPSGSLRFPGFCKHLYTALVCASFREKVL